MANLEELIRGISSRLDNLESEVITPLIATVTLLEKRVRDTHDDDDPAALQKGHKPWKCEGCRALLGYYDEARDILRVRVKDYHVQIRIGVDGWVESPCRRCGHSNRIGYSPPKG